MPTISIRSFLRSYLLQLPNWTYLTPIYTPTPTAIHVSTFLHTPTNTPNLKLVVSNYILFFFNLLRFMRSVGLELDFFRSILRFGYSTGYVFYAKFSFDCFDFSSYFVVSHDLNFSLVLKWQQLNASGGSSLLKLSWTQVAAVHYYERCAEISLVFCHFYWWS